MKHIARFAITVILFGAFAACQSTQSKSPPAPNSASPDSSGEPRPDQKDGVSTRETAPPSGTTDQKGCVQGDCDNGAGAFVYETGDRYTGGFKNGLREGQGIMEYSNGDRFEGTYIADQRNGQGTYTFKNKDVFVGQFKQGEREGTGSYRFAATGETYVGEIRGDGATGDGTVKNGDQELRCSLKGRSVLCEPVATSNPEPEQQQTQPQPEKPSGN